MCQDMPVHTLVIIDTLNELGKRDESMLRYVIVYIYCTKYLILMLNIVYTCRLK